MTHAFAWWPTVAVLGVATVTDLRSRRIPNWLVLPFLVAGFVVSGWLHGWQGLRPGPGCGAAWLAGARPEPGWCSAWPGDLWISILDGRHGRWRCKALCSNRGLDRSWPIVFRGSHYRYGGRDYGSLLGGLRRIPQRTFQRCRQSCFRLERTWRPSRSGVGLEQPHAPQDAICSGHRYRNVNFILCSLRD